MTTPTADSVTAAALSVMTERGIEINAENLRDYLADQAVSLWWIQHEGAIAFKAALIEAIRRIDEAEGC